VLAAALVVAGVVIRQETEWTGWRAEIAELTGLPREAAISTVQSAACDIEELVGRPPKSTG